MSVYFALELWKENAFLHEEVVLFEVCECQNEIFFLLFSFRGFVK